MQWRRRRNLARTELAKEKLNGPNPDDSGLGQRAERWNPVAGLDRSGPDGGPILVPQEAKMSASDIVMKRLELMRERMAEDPEYHDRQPQVEES